MDHSLHGVGGGALFYGLELGAYRAETGFPCGKKTEQMEKSWSLINDIGVLT